METQESIQEFWFGDGADDAVTAARQAKLWWSKDEALDALIRQRFATLSESALAGNLDDWASTSNGCLSLILLCDQFPRNMYRDTPVAFASDAKALALSKAGIASGLDKNLRAIQRVFFYLPFEHSESLANQDYAVTLFEQLASEASAEHKTMFDNFLNFALRHREVIRRFQRFPHRNKILGRVSTVEELAFLSQPGSSF
ncbi:MAG: DUF924 family protein [Pseudomonadota bacterium]